MEILTIDDPVRIDAVQRLKRIEGQARGVQRMLEEDRDCREIMQQLMALESATHALSIRLLEAFALRCLQSAHDPDEQEQLIAEMARMVTRLAH